jgi:hypothetical protein
MCLPILIQVRVTKVWATSIAQHGEVWFYYPSGSSNEIDSYVAYDFRENHWLIGSMARTCWRRPWRV